MIRETRKGRKLRALKAGVALGRRGKHQRPADAGLVPSRERDHRACRDIDFVDQAPVDGGRRGAYMYAPGT